MMAGQYVSYAVFTLICLTLLTLPFIAAFREWLKPTDLAPLPIAHHYSSDIDHFAKRLHADVKAKLGLGASTGYEDFDFVVDWVEDMNWGHARKRLISEFSIESPTPIRSEQPLYVKGNIHAGDESVFSRLYATGDIDLGIGSEVHDWAHANGAVRLGRQSVGLRRISAGTSIELNMQAWFERMQAPTLYFGASRQEVSAHEEIHQLDASFSDFPHAIQKTPSLFLIQGDCQLPANKRYQSSVVVTGFLTIGTGTTIIGDVKARKGVSLGSNAFVKGAVTCEKRIYLFKHARALGPLLSESDILIGAQSVIGLLDAPTTVNARNIIVEDGVVVHGTVWAHDIGMVKAS